MALANDRNALCERSSYSNMDDKTAMLDNYSGSECYPEQI